MSQTGSTQKDDLPADLSQPARRALHAAGCFQLEQVAAFSEAEILKLHGVGPRTIQSLRREFAARGLSFAVKKKDAGR